MARNETKAALREPRDAPYLPTARPPRGRPWTLVVAAAATALWFAFMAWTAFR